ncbi:type IV pilus secretin protein PilN2 [Pseudomonas luteola]|uniref:Type IV pilus secretin protein PilN2 n=2 Tax=Pseudomonas luteola TaxID=47886 RepID=A0A2X2BYM7_PSELU|nr:MULTISPECIES: hypothetical protein [Pseudomonas]SPY99898.1 type IV pilus secretin protein PilN2 [Pseudomonas luteola]SPZ00074.1 type IV pilus secretin protein PilN2 [Pseudomonas luteola]
MNLKLSALAVAVILSSGCAVQTDKRDTNRYSDEMYQSTQNQIGQVRSAATLAAKRASQVVDRPFITGKARPLSREVTLPAPLRGTVDTVMLYRDDADLITLASRIHDATGILVKVNPDALLPLDNFRPRLAEGQSGGSMGLMPPPTANINTYAALDSPLPVDGIRTAGPSLVAAAPSAIPVSRKPLAAEGSRPLPQVLDAIALRLGVYWKYDSDIGAIVFYRTETRAFEIRNAEMAADAEISLGLSGGIDSGKSSGMRSESKTGLKTIRDEKGPMAAILGRVKQYMTVAGQISGGDSGLLVVTDTKTALDQIQRYIEQENRVRSRRIDLLFEEITLENTGSNQAGVNWNLAFRGSGTGNGVDVTGLNSLLEQEGAALSVGASVGSGQWAGSSIAVQALSRLGKVVDRKINTFGSNNGQPATTGRPERQKYISELEQTQSISDSSKPTVSVTQEEEVSGRFLTVLPYAYSDGDINLAFKYDNTPTPTFEKQTLPDGSYVQSPHSLGDVIARSATVRSGQPYVIAAYTQNTTQYNERRVDRGAPMIFGGSDVSQQTDRVTVLVLTAMVRE